MELPSASKLLKLLKEAGKSSDYIIDVFVTMIQYKQMYGGSMDDLLAYQVNKVKAELHK